MERKERRISVDCTTLSQKNHELEEHCEYNDESTRHVRFDEDRLNKTLADDKTKVDGKLDEDVTRTNSTVHEITTRLKKSFQKVENDLEMIKRVCQELNLSKKSLGNCDCKGKCKKLDSINELDRLQIDADNLKVEFEKKAVRKRRYLEDLSRLQETIHCDRKKMEKWVQHTGASKRELESKLDESVKLTRDQQILIRKLKLDNEALWNILNEIQDHLKQEKNSDIINTGCSDKINISHTGLASNYASPFINNNQSPELSYFSVESDQNDKSSDIGGSTFSSQDGASEKFKKLIQESDKIKKIVLKSGCANNNSSNAIKRKCHCNACSSHKENYRIPSENENGVRSDMNDIIKRCEELEKKVEDCSAKDIRDRIVQQLKEIDLGSSLASTTCKKCPGLNTKRGGKFETFDDNLMFIA